MSTLKKLHKALLTLDDGTVLEVERIGKGRFTTAWRNCKDIYLQVHEDDYAKEILEGLSGTPHIPETRSLGCFDGSAPYRLYRQPIYRKLRAREHPLAWADFRALEAMAVQAHRDWIAAKPRNMNDPSANLSDVRYFRERRIEYAERFAQLVQESGIRDTLKEAVRALVDGLYNYGSSWCVEISKRNLAVHPDRDELILLDPVFDVEKIRREVKQ